jgi:hypothetical protein
MCLFTNGTELCSHPECINYYITQRSFSITSNDIISGIISVIQQQSVCLRDLVEKSETLNDKIEQINEIISKKSRPQQFISSDQFNIERIFRCTNEEAEYNMFISIVSDLPEIIYKEKGFEIIVNVIDSNGCKVIIPNTFPFIVSLFTKENPPKLLKTNISGRKILRGTCESVSDADGNIRFRNVVINEVTSHYPNDSFCLVIYSPGLSNLKSLATSGISVRARKHRK